MRVRARRADPVRVRGLRTDRMRVVGDRTDRVRVCARRRNRVIVIGIGRIIEAVNVRDAARRDVLEQRRFEIGLTRGAAVIVIALATTIVGR